VQHLSKQLNAKTTRLMRSVRLLIISFAFIISNAAISQDSTGISQISSKYFETVSKKAVSLEKDLDTIIQNYKMSR